MGKPGEGMTLSITEQFHKKMTKRRLETGDLDRHFFCRHCGHITSIHAGQIMPMQKSVDCHKCSKPISVMLPKIKLNKV